MLPAPFRFESELSQADYEKIGILTLRWSHIDHIIGNCLKVMLRQSDEEAIFTVFPLTTHNRLRQIKELAALNPMNADAQAALDELSDVMEGIRYVRNNVVHAIIIDNIKEDHVFHLRNKQRNITKADVFAVEELTNYAAHAVISLRYALGRLKGADPSHRHPLPQRPPIPTFLEGVIPTRAK